MNERTISLPPSRVADLGLVRLGSPAACDMRIALPPKRVADRGVVRLGGTNACDMRVIGRR